MSDVHAVARLCRTSVPDALALLSQAPGLAQWNLGLWRTREVKLGLLSGESLFGGGSGLARVQIDAARGLIDYAVGADEQSLVPRIQARVQAGAELGHAPGTCVVTLLAWRTAGMDDSRWQRLMAAHEVEIELIRCQLESGASEGTGEGGKGIGRGGGAA
ncbi:MAG: hypothetical protein OEY03_10400 [Rhizobacter sp.]|nr:hypothetical protein [Rhizobacter sp.]